MSVKAKANGTTYTLAEVSDIPAQITATAYKNTSIYGIVAAGQSTVYRFGNVAMLRVSGSAQNAMTAGTSYWVDDIRGEYAPMANVYGQPVQGGTINIAPKSGSTTSWEIRFTPSSNIAAGASINFQIFYFVVG